MSTVSKKRQSARLTMKRHTKGQQTYEFEDPSNGEMYNPREVWTILHDAARVHGAKAKRVIMNDLIREGKVGVKGEKALYNIYQKKCVEECPLDWNAKDRPRYVSPYKLNQIVSEKANGSTVTFGKRDITEIVNEGNRERARIHGNMLFSSTASPSTHERYASELKLIGVARGDLSICRHDNLTTEVRMVAGRSFR